jgi:hypothetical protein
MEKRRLRKILSVCGNSGNNKPLYFHWKLYKFFHIYADEHEGIMPFPSFK